MVIERLQVRSLIRERGSLASSLAHMPTSKRRSSAPTFRTLLNREFFVEHPNQVWCGDITNVWAQGCWHYLAVELDLHVRRFIGWAFSDKPDAELWLPVRSKWPTNSVADSSR